MKKFFIGIVLIVGFVQLKAQLLFADNFNYGVTSGSIITLSGGRWVENSTASAINIVQYDASSNLTFPALSVAGGKLAFLNTGQDITAGFSAVTSGDLFVGALVNFSAAQTTGDYFLHFMQSTTVNTYTGRVFVKLNGSNINFGLMKNSGGTVPYSTNSYLLNTTYCIVLKYTFNTASTTDDVATLYVFDAVTGLPATEPMTSEISANINTDATSISALGIRQGAATAGSTGAIDNLVVSTTWANLRAIMPVELKALNCFPTSNGLNIKWQSCNEVNFDYYDVEKSSNGKTFGKIATIKSVGNNSITNSYSYFDIGANQQTAYYRLKLVDKDGSFKYSQIVYNKVNGKIEVSVYPNPVAVSCTIAHAIATSNDLIRIMNAEGVVVKTIKPIVGSVQTTAYVANLKSGNYLVEYNSLTEKRTTQFVKY